jgi:hypothetical protein
VTVRLDHSTARCTATFTSFLAQIEAHTINLDCFFLEFFPVLYLVSRFKGVQEISSIEIYHTGGEDLIVEASIPSSLPSFFHNSA